MSDANRFHSGRNTADQQPTTRINNTNQQPESTPNRIVAAGRRRWRHLPGPLLALLRGDRLGLRSWCVARRQRRRRAVERQVGAERAAHLLLHRLQLRLDLRVVGLQHRLAHHCSRQGHATVSRSRPSVSHIQVSRSHPTRKLRFFTTLTLRQSHVGSNLYFPSE